MRPIPSRTVLILGNSGVRKLRVVFAIFFILIGGRAVAVDLNQLAHFNIPPGTILERALAEWSVQADVQLMSASTSGRPTEGVRGTYSARDALESLLEDTGLWYELHADTVLIRPLRRGDPGEPLCKGRRPKRCKPNVLESSAGPAATVTVTGELIRTAFDLGHIPAGDQSITLTRHYFSTGGFNTVGDVIRSLPQSYGGGLNVGVIFAGGSQNITSQSAASTVNLRGLGSDSTMLLVNGQRLSASEGSSAVDVTLIPLSAVERIEIMTGSASALYGSDAVAGVVNVVLRKDFRGVELSSALGYATEGGDFLHRYSAVAGSAIGDTSLFATADCAWQREIDAQQRTYIPANITGTTLMPGMQHCSTIVNATGFLTSTLEAGVLGAYTKRFAYQAESLTVLSTSMSASTRSDVAQYAVNPTFKWNLPHRWTAAFAGSLSADNVSSPERVILSGAPDQYMGARFGNRLWSGQIIASGPIPKTRAELALGVGYNQQGFLFGNLPGGEDSISKQRRIRFAFAESVIPILQSRQGRRDPSALSLHVAVRTDHYSDVGGTTNAKVALAYKPSSSLKLSASWGTSFRAPSLLQLYGSTQALLEFVPDRASDSGQTLALLRFGGNPLLTPEKSTDAGLGLTFTPEAVPDASLLISYYNISYRRRIEFPTPNTTDPLSDRNVAPFITRDPSPDQINQVLEQSQLMDLTAGHFSARDAVLLIDDRNQNFARQRVSGVDLSSKYGHETAFGRLDTTLNVAYLDLQQQITSRSEIVPLSGTVFYPPTWRGRFGVSWNRGRYLGSLFVNYTGGSREVSAPAQEPGQSLKPIPSWTTLDGQIGMILGGDLPRGSTKLTLSAQNLLDRHPPLINFNQLGPAGVNYDSTNSSAVGRFLTLQLTVAW